MALYLFHTPHLFNLFFRRLVRRVASRYDVTAKVLRNEGVTRYVDASGPDERAFASDLAGICGNSVVSVYDGKTWRYVWRSEL